MEIEQDLDVVFPEDYKNLLQTINGQQFSGYSCMVNWLPTRMRLLPVQEVPEKWNYFQQFSDDNFTDEFWDIYQDGDKIRGVIYHEKRIPVAECEGVAELLMDFIPGPNGEVGQLITNINECDYIVLARNFTEYITNLQILLDKEILAFRKKDNDDGGFELFSSTENWFEADDMVKLFQKYC